MKALSIVESAYRATIEEQDDTIVWLNHAMKAAGADLAVLLRGNAVNYAVRGQNAAGLAFGAWRQTQPPRIADDLASLAGKGVTVYVLAEDLAEHGIEPSDLVPGLERVTRDGLPALFAAHDQIWHW
jgi:intracellular sulfur oxidation DsrE/DsrF family protein